MERPVPHPQDRVANVWRMMSGRDFTSPIVMRKTAERNARESLNNAFGDKLVARICIKRYSGE